MPLESVTVAGQIVPFKITKRGSLKLHCVFHKEKKPSLHIYKTGSFKCHGCAETGHVKDHYELYVCFDRARYLQVEEAGQMRFPWFE